jgi:hypothetical protein
MSLSTGGQFDFGGVDLPSVDGNTSILLVGDDAGALESVSYRLLAGEEPAALLHTQSSGRAVQRDLNGVQSGAGDNARVLTPEGAATGDDVTVVDDVGDLTSVGMHLSATLDEVQAAGERFRAGIYLGTDVAASVSDTRSMYRFLNSNFLTPIRRNEGLGVCAMDTTTDIGADVDSTLAGMSSSFSARVDVERMGRREVRLDTDDLGAAGQSVTLSL